MPETELSRALNDITPEPPLLLRVDDLLRQAKHRHRARLARVAVVPIVVVGFLWYHAAEPGPGSISIAPGSNLDGPSHTVTGVLENVGGPPFPGPSGTFRSGHYPFAGVVTFHSAALTLSTTAGVDGTFSLDLPDGTYSATGHATDTSPGAPSPSADDPCRSRVDVVVSGADQSGVAVVCDIP